MTFTLIPKVLRIFVDWNAPSTYHLGLLFGSGPHTRILYAFFRMKKRVPELKRWYVQWHQVDHEESWGICR